MLRISAEMKTKKYWKETFEAYLYLLPAFVILGMFSFYPVVKSVIISFHDWHLLRKEQYFIGFENYQKLLNDKTFLMAISNTFRYVIGFVPISICLALIIAVLLNSKIRFRGTLRLDYFLPWVTSSVAISMVWRWIYNQHYGLLNMALASIANFVNSLVEVVTLGNVAQIWEFSNINWLMEPRWTIINIVIISVWKSIGYYVVIFLAGLQNVPNDLYEAAEVDGANAWQKFINITIPQLHNTLIFVMISTTILAFKLFDQVKVMTNGGPQNSTMTTMLYAIQQGWAELRIGYASAITVIFFTIVLVISILQRFLIREKGAKKNA